MMGASNPHPHGQIWATATLPNEPAREQAAHATALARPTAAACCATTWRSRRRGGERMVCENERFVALVPFWAVWPFETLVLAAAPRRRPRRASTTTSATALADMLKRLTTRYDNLFETPFPYSMGFHQRRSTASRTREWHLHAHFYPPLLRSATVRKFMVGFEMLGTPQRDMTPEEPRPSACARLERSTIVADVTRARVQVALTSFVALFSIVGLALYGLPLYYDFMVRDFGWSRTQVTSGNALSKLLVGPLFGFAAGWFVDRFGPRRLMIAGVLMAGVALIGLGRMSALWMFYFFYLLNALGYVCGGPLPNQVLLSRWFDAGRGKAMGFAYLGIGIGGAIVPILSAALSTRSAGGSRCRCSAG